MITEVEKSQIKINRLLTDKRVLLENQIRLLEALLQAEKVTRIYREQLLDQTKVALEFNETEE